MDGIPLLPEGGSILEVKVQAAMPLWLSAILDEGQIYKSSFSKYGEAYTRERTKAAPPVQALQTERPALRVLRSA
jgi:hypothetical protein